MKDSLAGVRPVRVLDGDGDGYTFAVLPPDFLPGMTAAGTAWKVERLLSGDIVAGLANDDLARLCVDLLGDGDALATRMGELVMLLAGPDRWKNAEDAIWVAASMAARTNGN